MTISQEAAPPAASGAEAAHLEGDTGCFGESMEAHDSFKRRVVGKSWPVWGKNHLDIQMILEGFIHMLTSSTIATGMSLAFDPRWKKLLSGS